MREEPLHPELEQEHEQPADLAEAAIGLTPEQLAQYEAVIVRFLRGEYFSLDEEGKVADWNRQAEGRFGWSAVEVVGEDFFEYIASPAARDAARAELTPCVAGSAYEGPAGCAFGVGRSGALARGNGYRKPHRGAPRPTVVRMRPIMDAGRSCSRRPKDDRAPWPYG